MDSWGGAPTNPSISSSKVVPETQTPRGVGAEVLTQHAPRLGESTSPLQPFVG